MKRFLVKFEPFRTREERDALITKIVIVSMTSESLIYSVVGSDQHHCIKPADKGYGVYKTQADAKQALHDANQGGE